MSRYLKWAHVYRFYEGVEPLLNYSVPKEERPRGQRIVVLAPHIDDESIGCGGVMQKHAAAGGRLAILTFADCSPERIAEGRAAGCILGVQRQEFLPYAAKTLLDEPELPNRLAAFLAEEKPDLVYVPSPLDRHADHLAVNILLARHTRKHGGAFMVYGYEVWSTLTPNVAVDISAQKEGKAAALACFASQNRSNDWHDAALSLNRYRGITTGAGHYAETFYRQTASAHAAGLEKMLGRL